MNEENWKQILATDEPVPMPAISATGTDVVRQFRAALWVSGHIVLSLNEVKGLVDQC